MHDIFSSMGSGITVSFAGLAKHFDLRLVFKEISGEARPGEVLVLTGPNGSGKSTLLSILCGLTRPSRGVVRYLVEGGRRGAGHELQKRLWREHVGVVSPSMTVYEELDAIENLRFFARVRGVDGIESRCRSTLARVGLDPDRQTLVRGYSTGMAQRLKIAQAMLHEPGVLLLDEPGSNLDPAGVDWLEAWVQEMVDKGRTVILATNDLREMGWGASRVALAG